MIHIGCYSGGLSSARVAVYLVKKFGKENVILVNHQCILEEPDVARFEEEVAAYLGIPITYVSFNGWETKDQFDVVIEKGSFINPEGSREALCTHVMKTEPFMKWMQFNFPVSDNLFYKKVDCIVYYGFDANEENRILRRSSIMAAHGYKTAFPIAHNAAEVISSTTEIGIEPPNTYNIFKHANCVGCLKAGWQHWYCVYCLRKDIWEKGKVAEDIIGYSIHKDAYLEEKEEEFDRMISAGIEPTEKIKPQTWWALVKKRLKEFDGTICTVSETDERPCACFED